MTFILIKQIFDDVLCELIKVSLEHKWCLLHLVINQNVDVDVLLAEFTSPRLRMCV